MRVSKSTSSLAPDSSGHVRALFFASLTSAGIILSLACFSGAAADDFSPWVILERTSIFGAAAHYYFNWTGRWAGALVSAFIASEIDFYQHYTTLLLAISFVSYLGTLATVRCCWGQQISWRQAAAYALILQSLIYVISPALRETVFWLNGALYYSLGFAVAQLVYLACVYHLQKKSPASIGHMSQTLALMGAAFFVAGFNEILSVYWIFVILASVILAFILRTNSRWSWLAILSAAVAGTATMILAPGNSVRVERLKEVHTEIATPGSILALFLSQVLEHLPGWLLDPRLMALSGIYLFWPYEKLPIPEWIRSRYTIKTRFIFVTWIAGLALGFFIPSFAIRDSMPSRALSVIHGWTILGWFLILTITLRRRIGLIHSGEESIGRNLRHFFMTLLIAGLLLTGNTATAIRELHSGIAAQHRQNYQALHAILMDAKVEGMDEVVVPHLPRISALLYYQRISVDPHYWQNLLLRDYYGLRQLQLESDPDPVLEPPEGRNRNEESRKTPEPKTQETAPSAG